MIGRIQKNNKCWPKFLLSCSLSSPIHAFLNHVGRRGNIMRNYEWDVFMGLKLAQLTFAYIPFSRTQSPGCS